MRLVQRSFCAPVRVRCSSFACSTASGRARVSLRACPGSISCHTFPVPKTMAISIRMEKQLLDLLAEGAKRTPLNQRDLLRQTLRLHLREVIEAEAIRPAGRLTTVRPWARGALARA